MITLYTAIGAYKLNNRGLPTVISGGREYGLDSHELLLWSSLAFRILTYQELRAEFYQKEHELRILGESDFDHYLNRLVMRRLIVSGKDYTGMDALYDLLGHLHVQPVPNSFPVKAVSFLKLVFCHRLPLHKAALIFHSGKPDAPEKHVLSLVRHQTLSTAELILCTENGRKSLKNTAELMECLYADEDTDCETVIIDGRTSETRRLVLSAVANLYLKQRIIFQIV